MSKKGRLVISNPTDTVNITIIGEPEVVSYSLTVTEGGSNGGSFTIEYDNGTSESVRAGTYASVNKVLSVTYYGESEGKYYTINGNEEPLPYTLTSNTTAHVVSSCMIAGTKILLANGDAKNIEDITYDDELLVWNFYTGKFDTAKPEWIMKEQITDRYNLVKFSDGSEIGFVGPGEDIGYHRVYNDEAKAFTHTGVAETPNGTHTFNIYQEYPTIVSQEVINKQVKYYNIITKDHYNLFANGILTSCRLSNKYAIENMKYVGEPLISEEQIKEYFDNIKNIKKEEN